jgi:hypothetical protein
VIEYYDFDLPAAVTSGLRILVRRNAPTDLLPENITIVAAACGENDTTRGVYVICWGTRSMYVGKADNLPHRLAQHLVKLSGRIGIPMGEIGFKAILLHRNWSTSANENLLIQTFKKIGQCEWNGMGFGPKDTGGKRDDTKPNAFDTAYPINHNLHLDGLPSELTVSELVVLLKKRLPFVFRHDKHLLPDSSDEASRAVRPANAEAWELVKQLADVLGPNWQATLFANRITLYQRRTSFENANEIYP